jgi:hypothetical protein
MILDRVRQMIVRASRKFTIRAWSSRIIEQAHPVSLVDVRQKSDDFRETIVAALDSLKITDPRRYQRVVESFDWIVNSALSTGGAEYQHWARACVINFEEAWPGRDFDFSVAWHAAVLVHEATHAHLSNRGIAYDDSNCERIERLCVKEQNRWAAGLEDKELGQKLYQEFDPNDWDFCWNASRLTHLKSTIRNACSD